MSEISESYAHEAVPLDISYARKKYKGLAWPVSDTCRGDVCFELEVTLNGKYVGRISCGRDLQWSMPGAEQGLVNAIGEKILLWYE